MKHLKTYESDETEPQVGDYVICYEPSINLKAFIENNIGQIDKINIELLGHINSKIYYVKYDNMPEELLIKHKGMLVDNNRAVFKEEILHISKYKEDLEPYISSKKYNL